MKTQCLQTNEMQHCFGKESALGAGLPSSAENVS